MDELTETFVPVRDHPLYEISNKGNVMNVRKRQIMKPWMHTEGYWCVDLVVSKTNRTRFRLHRLIAIHFIPNPDNLPYVDHIDGNRLNNSIENLRWCTMSQNNMNKGATPGSSSSYKGVSWTKDKNKWKAFTKLNGKMIHLGYHECEEDAARAYDAKARELHGEFVRLNFPDA